MQWKEVYIIVVLVTEILTHRFLDYMVLLSNVTNSFWHGFFFWGFISHTSVKVGASKMNSLNRSFYKLFVVYVVMFFTILWGINLFIFVFFWGKCSFHWSTWQGSTNLIFVFSDFCARKMVLHAQLCMKQWWWVLIYIV